MKSTHLLRLPHWLLFIGFIGVLSGTVASLVGVATLTSGSELISFFASPISYGLVGLAWCQWTARVEVGSPEARAMRMPTRTLSIAALIASIGWLAVVYGNLRFYYAFRPAFLSHFRLHVAGDAAQAAGFLLAAAALWIAPNLLRGTDRVLEGSDSDGSALAASTP